MSLELRAPNQGARAPRYGRIADCPGWVCAAEGSLAGDIRSDPNQTLAEILAAVQPCDRTRCLLDSVEGVLSIPYLRVAHPDLEFPHCLGTALNMVKDEKALHSRAFDEKMTLDARS